MVQCDILLVTMVTYYAFWAMRFYSCGDASMSPCNDNDYSYEPNDRKEMGRVVCYEHREN